MVRVGALQRFAQSMVRKSGRNRFHRLAEFDQGERFGGIDQSGGARNLVLGVTASDGGLLTRKFRCHPAHLFLLSPGGIQLMLGSFVQIQPHLSTASQLRFDGGVFVCSTQRQVVLARSPAPLAGAMVLGSLGDERPWIRMEGCRLMWMKHSGRCAWRPIDLDNTRLSVSNRKGDGGTLTLMADDLLIDGTSQLLAKGSKDGGLIRGWQLAKCDASVRRRSPRVWMPVPIDASATGVVMAEKLFG